MREPLQELVTEIVVFFSFGAKALPVKSKNTRRFKRSCCKLPLVRWEQPRPSENLALSKGQDGEGAAALGDYLQRHFPLANEIKLVGISPLLENELPRLKADVGGTVDYESEVALWKAAEKLMLAQNTFKCFHCCFSPRSLPRTWLALPVVLTFWLFGYPESEIHPHLCAPRRLAVLQQFLRRNGLHDLRQRGRQFGAKILTKGLRFLDRDAVHHNGIWNFKAYHPRQC